MSYWEVQEQLRLLAGKLLTFVDMAITDKQANKAWKDVIKQEFHKRFTEVQSFCSDGKSGECVDLEPTPTDRLI